MAIWQILRNLAVSDAGEVVNRLSKTTRVSSNGTVYTTMGKSTFGSDGSVYTGLGQFSSDGSVKMGHTATGLGAVFNQDDESDGGL